jgi:hypothetical protein
MNNVCWTGPSCTCTLSVITAITPQGAGLAAGRHRAVSCPSRIALLFTQVTRLALGISPSRDAPS